MYWSVVETLYVSSNTRHGGGFETCRRMTEERKPKKEITIAKIYNNKKVRRSDVDGPGGGQLENDGVWGGRTLVKDLTVVAQCWGAQGTHLSGGDDM